MTDVRADVRTCERASGGPLKSALFLYVRVGVRVNVRVNVPARARTLTRPFTRTHTSVHSYAHARPLARSHVRTSVRTSVTTFVCTRQHTYAVQDNIFYEALKKANIYIYIYISIGVTYCQHIIHFCCQRKLVGGSENVFIFPFSWL